MSATATPRVYFQQLFGNVSYGLVPSNRVVMRALPLGIALLAAWGSVRYPWLLPLFWVLFAVEFISRKGSRSFPLCNSFVALALALLSVNWLFALDHEKALQHSALFVLIGLVLTLSQNFAASPSERWVAAGIALTAVISIIQVSTGFSGERETLVGLAAPWTKIALARLDAGRAWGTAALPGHSAILLVMVTPLIVAAIMQSRGRMRWGWGALLTLAATGVVLTRSLSALIVVAVLVAILVWRKLTIGQLALVAAGFFVVALAVGFLRHDLADLAPIRLRWANWQASAWVFVHHPLLGVGLGGVDQGALAGPFAASSPTPYTHNTFLQLLTELGLAGVGVVAVALIALIRLIRRGLVSQLPLSLAVATVPIHNIVDFSAYAPEVVLPWAVLTSMLAGRVLLPPTRETPRWLILTLIGAGTMASILMWQSHWLRERIQSGEEKQPVRAAIALTRWMPWAIGPLLDAVASEFGGDRDLANLARLETELAKRQWCAPLSASWAQARAHLALAQGRRGEALVWAREARRRAPWREDLMALEAACASR